MKVVNKSITIVLITAFVAISASCNGNTKEFGTKNEIPKSTTDSSISKIQTVIIPIQGMTCSACAARIKRGIKEVKGVQEVEVSLERREAKVKFNSKDTTPEIISKAIDDLGYKTKKPIIQK